MGKEDNRVFELVKMSATDESGVIDTIDAEDFTVDYIETILSDYYDVVIEVTLFEEVAKETYIVVAKDLENDLLYYFIINRIL